jgi:diguanylate cyclase (GGDEF)-like protein
MEETHAVGGPFGRWLRGDPSDQARYVDMHVRFADAPLFGVAVGGTSLLVAWWAGWSLVALVALASVVMGVGLTFSSRFRHPETLGALTFGLLELDLALSVLASGGGDSPLLPLLVIPVFTQAVCFRPQVIWWFVGMSTLLATGAVALAGAWGGDVVTPSWVHLVAYAALLWCLALAAQYLATSDRSSRDEAVIDPLTGLHNRKALDARFVGVRAQATVRAADVAVVMCDVDCFKAVNDTYGHQRGDQVLKALAMTMQATLRSSDLLYRIGGEELLVVLPGHDLAAAEGVAERLRHAVAAQLTDGLPVTISAGVASARGAAVDLAELTSRADRALYGAKAAGRNQVRCAAPSPHPGAEPPSGWVPMTSTGLPVGTAARGSVRR